MQSLLKYELQHALHTLSEIIYQSPVVRSSAMCVTLPHDKFCIRLTWEEYNIISAYYSGITFGGCCEEQSKTGHCGERNNHHNSERCYVCTKYGTVIIDASTMTFIRRATEEQLTSTSPLREKVEEDISQFLAQYMINPSTNVQPMYDVRITMPQIDSNK